MRWWTYRNSKYTQNVRVMNIRKNSHEGTRQAWDRDMRRVIRNNVNHHRFEWEKFDQRMVLPLLEVVWLVPRLFNLEFHRLDWYSCEGVAYELIPETVHLPRPFHIRASVLPLRLPDKSIRLGQVLKMITAAKLLSRKSHNVPGKKYILLSQQVF